MSKLADLFSRPLLASLAYESDTCIVLSVQDPTTGAISRVEISADMVAVPPEALLFVKVDDEWDGVDLAAWWAQGDEADTKCPLCQHTGQMDDGGMCWMPIGESGRTLSSYLPFADEGEPQPCGCYCPNSFIDMELLPTWAITPDGQEFEVGSGGLFQS